MYDADYIQHAELTQRLKNGANWFYWIAGLTIITSVITFFGGGWRFFISLGTTQLIDGLADALAGELGQAAKVVALVFDLVITGAFVGFGVLAGKKYLWAYVLGMAVFLLDGLVNLVIQDWIGLIAHVVVLVLMVPGFLAGRELASLEKRMAAEQAAQAPPQPEAV
jgi:hypothetical protein